MINLINILIDIPVPVKHLHIQKSLNMIFQVLVHPFRFATVPVDVVSLVSLVCGPKFLYEEKPLHIWTATGLVVT